MTYTRAMNHRDDILELNIFLTVRDVSVTILDLNQCFMGIYFPLILL
jgi:hypothetical protein